MTPRWLLVGLALLVAACPRVVVPVEAPRLSIADGALVLAPDAAGVELTLTVGNVNQGALRLEAVDWELAADDRPLARGRVELTESIPAGAAAPVRLAVALSAAQSARLGAAVSAGAALSLSGTVHARLGPRLLASDFFHAQ